MDLHKMGKARLTKKKRWGKQASALLIWLGFEISDPTVQRFHIHARPRLSQWIFSLSQHYYILTFYFFWQLLYSYLKEWKLASIELDYSNSVIFAWFLFCLQLLFYFYLRMSWTVILSQFNTILLKSCNSKYI